MREWSDQRRDKRASASGQFRRRDASQTFRSRFSLSCELWVTRRDCRRVWGVASSPHASGNRFRSDHNRTDKTQHTH
eukprot:291216-Prymnesium_polylepis.1